MVAGFTQVGKLKGRQRSVRKKKVTIFYNLNSEVAAYNFCHVQHVRGKLLEVPLGGRDYTRSQNL